MINSFELHSETEEKEKRAILPFDIVNAGDHWDRNISKQMEPLLLMFGWYIRVVKATLGGLNG